MTIYFPGRGTLIEEKYLEGRAEGRAEGIEEGMEKGSIRARVEERRQMVLRLLDAHGVPLLPSSLRRIQTCTDLSELAYWLDRACTATSEQDLFAPREP